MHKLLIAFIALWATTADAAPACMSKQACINSDNGYCRYTPTSEGKCWSTNVAFLRGVKKAERSERRHARIKPRVGSEPKILSEPMTPTETHTTSEPSETREPALISGPVLAREPTPSSEPYNLREPHTVSEPLPGIEPVQTSEPSQIREPSFRSAPASTREPKRSSDFKITMIGIFAFASAFLGFNAARILNEHPIYFGFPKLPPPPLDLANSIHRMVPALPEPSPVLLDLGQFVREAQRRIH